MPRNWNVKSAKAKISFAENTYNQKNQQTLS